MKQVSAVIFLLTQIVLSGCATNEARPGDPRYAPVFPVTPQPAPQTEGSIYASGGGVSMWEDQRARRVGDILTILLDERTTSSKSSSTETTKNDENNMSVSSLLGTTPSSNIPFIGSNSDLTLNTQTSNEREFEGEAAADQSNRLSGSITVTVTNVLPSGVLMVRGEKWMTLTRGSEFIRIEGMIRPSDIGPDNTVQSTRIADARITYSETGELADSNRKGWLSRFFNSPVWPF
ncbi:MAG: flagellar basal body L-ring protein FlgH [Ketobacteraceae bacterium]|nr:flagellar basal body L-ring protein FlgH [Ketobacteraceae bacterium]